jgi:hypothetical protein
MSKTNHTRALLVLLAALVAGLMALAGLTPREAQAAFPGKNDKIAVASNRITGQGVDNPEGDQEIITMNPDGTDLKQLTKNNQHDLSPVL